MKASLGFEVIVPQRLSLGHLCGRDAKSSRLNSQEPRERLRTVTFLASNFSEEFSLPSSRESADNSCFDSIPWYMVQSTETTYGLLGSP